jgi:hypothetical protein
MRRYRLSISGPSPCPECPLFVADKEAVSKLFFELGDLLTERGLSYVQPIGGTGEIKFFG